VVRPELTQPSENATPIGTGNNIIYVVAVMRWIERGAADGIVERQLAAIEPQQVQ
jgi:hypothetical protein